MVVQDIKSVPEFKSCIENNPRVIVDCFAEWCGPCKTISPIVEQLSNNFTNATFIKIDVDEVPDLAQELGVRAMPTFIFFKDGEKVDEAVGANPNAIRAAVESLVA